MCKYVANIVSVNGGAVGNISPINEIHTGQNPARHLTLRGAAARGALTFFRLTQSINQCLFSSSTISDFPRKEGFLVATL